MFLYGDGVITMIISDTGTVALMRQETEIFKNVHGAACQSSAELVAVIACC
jgi:hypothetical protein